LRNNYTAYINDRETLGGGVFVLVHNDIIAVENPELVTNCELEWIKIQRQERTADRLILHATSKHGRRQRVRKIIKPCL